MKVHERSASEATFATRRSALALAQSRAFIARVRSSFPETSWRELQVTTSGDRIQDRPLSEVGGKGLFVKEIEEALLEQRADVAVHSMKDMPALLPPGLTIGCVPARIDPRDALVAPRHRSLSALPRGSRVGTSSLRRVACLRALRPDLRVEPLRGNVDTRLRKLDEGQFDAIVLAAAGLSRLGLEGRTTELLDPHGFVPAPGQGALAIECRDNDPVSRALIGPLHDPDAALCVAAERGVLVAVGGDCKTPLGAYAVRAGNDILLRCFVALDPVFAPRRAEHRGPFPSTQAAAHALGLEVGARALNAETRAG